MKKYSVNEEYFKIIDTPDKAYFLGWMISDGYNKETGFMLSIQERDKQVLENFKEHIKYTGPLYNIKGNCENCQNIISLNITNKALAIDLTNLGVIKKKSKSTYIPPIKKELYPYLIRGIFEGDGWISNSGRISSFGISGNKGLMKEIQIILEKECNIKTFPIRKTTTYVFTISGYSKISRIYNYLYKDNLNLKLDRKYNKFLEAKTTNKDYILYKENLYTVAEFSELLYKRFNIPITTTKKRIQNGFTVEQCLISKSQMRAKINKERILKRNK